MKPDRCVLTIGIAHRTMVVRRQRDGDTNANERTNDGTNNDIIDGSNDGASMLGRKQLHVFAHHVAHF